MQKYIDENSFFQKKKQYLTELKYLTEKDNDQLDIIMRAKIHSLLIIHNNG